MSLILLLGLNIYKAMKYVFKIFLRWCWMNSFKGSKRKYGKQIEM